MNRSSEEGISDSLRLSPSRYQPHYGPAPRCGKLLKASTRESQINAATPSRRFGSSSKRKCVIAGKISYYVVNLASIAWYVAIRCVPSMIHTSQRWDAS